MSSTEKHRQAIVDELEECMFCGDDLDDAGLAFLEHVEDNPECHTRYESWKVDIDQDWGGG